MTTVLDQFATEFRGMVNETVTIKAKSSQNNYGEASYAGAGNTFPAYVTRRKDLAANLEQRFNTVQYTAYIASTTLTVNLDDQITFSDGNIRPIIAIYYARDEFGQQGVVLTVGAA